MTTILSRRIERLEVAFYLVYIVSLALIFFSDLANRPIWVDEAFTYYQVSSRSFSSLLDSFSAGVNAIPYSYFILLWGIDQLFGLGPASLRLPSLIFAIAAIIVLHRILITHFGNRLAFITCASALLMSEDFILHSHEARPYSLYALAAVFSLYSSVALLRGKNASNFALSVNCLAAFALPSVHYVGIFYSFCVAVVVLFAGRAHGRLYLFKVASSFCIGWAFFLLFHLSQILLFAQNGSAIDPAWIPKPTLYDALTIATHFFALPLVISMTLIAFVGFRLFKTAPVHPRPSPYLAQSSIDTFLFVLALIWLAIPPFFYFFGAIGLTNLSLPRYFLPSHLAVAIMAALLLSTLTRYELGKGGGSSIHAINAGILLSILFLTYQAAAAVKKIHWAKGWEIQAPNNYSYVTDSEIPCVTNNVHQFFPYSFYRNGRQILYFLKRTPFEVSKFKRLDNRLPILSLDELTQLSAFRFVYQKGTVNSFAEFDIHAWGKANGYVITDIGKRSNVDLYTAQKK